MRAYSLVRCFGRRLWRWLGQFGILIVLLSDITSFSGLAPGFCPIAFDVHDCVFSQVNPYRDSEAPNGNSVSCIRR